MILGIGLSLLSPWITVILQIISSLLSMLNTATTFIGPLLQGLATFMVWYVKEFFMGLAVIVGNLSTLAVIFAIILGTSYYVHQHDVKNLKAAGHHTSIVDQVKKSRKFISPNTVQDTPLPSSKNKTPVFTPFDPLNPFGF